MSLAVPSIADEQGAGQRLRLRLRLQGVVQGVGFRPHVYRLATQIGVSGWVGNDSSGLVIEVEGTESALKEFRRRLEGERPPGSSVQSLEAVWLEPTGREGFQIQASEAGGTRTALVRPDVATCGACVREIFDPGNRRYGYAFTNCTHCGPRYSIMDSLPYDRGNTSMKGFVMCAACRAEYEDPSDRRFHAQPNACPECGPQLELWSAAGEVLVRGAGALAAAVEALRCGRILAVKGLGGFHLMTDARADRAVETLRSRKQREEKPLAVMVQRLSDARGLCEVSDLEQQLLLAPEAPIVLLRRRANGEGQAALAAGVAPGNPFLGVMLPSTPLHHLLLGALRFPVVATSGNLSDEPICIDENEARQRLSGIVDGFLVHDRPILRHVDDSVVRVVAGREMIVRRARGYSPLPVMIGDSERSFESQEPGTGPCFPVGKGILAVGGQQKNSVALGTGRSIVLSQHIGDMDTPAALSVFRRVIEDLQGLFEIRPDVVVCDLHPDYVSTREARDRPGRHLGVQHHFAHILACMAENELQGPVLGISWDGTGYGLDGMIWGGEFLVAERSGYERFATLRPFPLPGGERAIREPRRSAMGLLYEHSSDSAFELAGVPTLASFGEAELSAVHSALERKFNAPLTTSAGRLFDAVASLLGVRQRVSFEGQAAMALEWLVGPLDEAPYEILLKPAASAVGGQPAAPSMAMRDAVWHADWAPMIDEILSDLRVGAPTARMAARFHGALIELMGRVAAKAGLERVALSGGCFQNVVLLEGAIERLRMAGHRVYWHQRVPTNDGGLALGQAVAGLWGREEGARA